MQIIKMRKQPTSKKWKKQNMQKAQNWRLYA